MPKLSEYIEMAANDYLQETGKTELSARWVAEFYQNSGLLDDYPRLNLITFFALVQKSLVAKAERTAKEIERQLEKAEHASKQRRRA